MYHRQPRIKMFGQPHQALGCRRKGLENGLVQSYPDRELDKHGAQASDGVYPMLFVELHGFLGNPRSVFRVAYLELLELGLQGRHSP